jgi:hypothetical protein
MNAAHELPQNGVSASSTGGNLIGFVPDAYGSVSSDVLIEGLPCGEVGGVARLDERTVDMGGESACMDGGHWVEV